MPISQPARHTLRQKSVLAGKAAQWACRLSVQDVSLQESGIMWVSEGYSPCRKAAWCTDWKTRKQVLKQEKSEWLHREILYWKAKNKNKKASHSPFEGTVAEADWGLINNFMTFKTTAFYSLFFKLMTLYKQKRDSIIKAPEGSVCPSLTLCFLNLSWDAYLQQPSETADFYQVSKITWTLNVHSVPKWGPGKAPTQITDK